LSFKEGGKMFWMILFLVIILGVWTLVWMSRDDDAIGLAILVTVVLGAVGIVAFFTNPSRESPRFQSWG